MSPLRDGQFAREVARAAAQRGRMDPVYQDLSEHFRLMFQKLYPVWVLLGPGLGSPAHIELTSRTVMMDSERLLGDRATIIAGALLPFRILVTIGVGLHEVFHAAHTKTWVGERDLELAESNDPDDQQLAEDRRLLEEPRMEAHGVRDHAPATGRGRFVRKALRAAVADVLLPEFGQLLAKHIAFGVPISRDLCGRSMTYLQARTHCGTVDPQILAPLIPIWEQILGRADMAALDDLYARLVWVDDGDNAALDRFAQEYRAIIGPPPPPPPGASEGSGYESGAAGDVVTGDPTDPGGDGGSGTAGSAPGDADGPTVGSLKDALEQAIAAGRDGELKQLNEDVSLQDLLAEQAGQTDSATDLGKGSGTGAPTGRMPDRGVNRAPFPDEVQAAVRYATRLARARSAGFKLIDKRTPGGRFNTRAHVRGRAQRQHGAPVTSHPWNIRKEVRTPLLEPHVGLVIDTSGSMSGYEYALGPIDWIIDTGLQNFGGRLATALFGNGCELLSDGAKPLGKVPGIQTGGGTAFGGDAVEMVCDQLDMENRRRPRFLYVLSDGGWYDSENGVAKIRWLRTLGVPTIHISIGIAPLSVEADRIVVIDDPATAMDIIADDTVEALRRPAQRPIVAQPAALVERVR